MTICYQEEALGGGDHLIAFREALPWLPSADDYDDIDSQTIPKPHVVSLPPPPSTPNTPSDSTNYKGYPQPPLTSPSDSMSSPPPMPRKLVDPAQLLSRLRHTFQHTEQSLYSQLSNTPVSSLNDVHRSFLSSTRGAGRWLQAWHEWTAHTPSAHRGPCAEGFPGRPNLYPGFTGLWITMHLFFLWVDTRCHIALHAHAKIWHHYDFVH
jgi:hypothetical protein